MQEKSYEQVNEQKRGYNLLDKEEEKSLFACFFEQLNDPLIFILFAAAAISLLLREYGDMCIILAVVLLNAMVGVIQEGKAKRALEALEKMTSPHALIHDADGIREIPAADLIPGDIVCLEAGRQVPADIRIISAVNLKIEESALTGESVPVSKNTTDQNEAYMTTNVTCGRGEGVVTAIGMDTKIGGIAKLLSGTKTELTPLQKRLADLGKLLGTVSVFFVHHVICNGSFAETQCCRDADHSNIIGGCSGSGRTAGDRYNGTGTFRVAHGKGKYNCKTTAECGDIRLCECGMLG